MFVEVKAVLFSVVVVGDVVDVDTNEVVVKESVVEVSVDDPGGSRVVADAFSQMFVIVVGL